MFSVEPIQVDAQQRVAQWLERVLVENRCGAARGAERPAKVCSSFANLVLDLT